MAIDRKRTEDRLRYLSVHDALTGLYNRLYFEEEMARLDRGRQFPVSILLADMDGLKSINDTYGHAAGDETLRQAAAVLRSVFRAEDGLARIGGDEFAVLLPQTGAEAAAQALDRARRAAAELKPSDCPITPRLSFGCATASRHQSILEAYKQADREMYKDKEGKR
jgi:diguanylate cyclase (GGDEF)-like protein